MSVVEMWVCDFHEADAASDYVHEDDALDDGWLQLSRKVESIGVWAHDGRMCPECQTDSDRHSAVVEQVRREGWRALLGSENEQLQRVLEGSGGTR